jgi:hypothetical protein
MDSASPDPEGLGDSDEPLPAPLAAATQMHPERRSAALVRLVRAVADVDPAAIESAARRLGQSRRILTPLAWAAGALVLMVQGVKLLILNWRLSLVQLVPAAWVWLTMWDLKTHLLHGTSFAHVNLVGRMALAAAVVAITIAAFWCNTVFAFAIDGPPPPRIAPAIRLARPHWQMVATSGLAVGVALAFAAVVVPRFAGIWLFSLVLGVVLAVMVISFVAVPARIIGVKSPKLSRKESIGRAAAGGALSAVAMAPGYLLGRVGLILLGAQNFHALGFVMLSIGSALYAAAMSSVKAVKLSMKLTPTVPADAPIVEA